jgi:septal ring factor EnvC (AmiA/AmiB activator)
LNVNGWLIAWGLAMSVIAIAASLIAVLALRAKQHARAQHDRLNLENESLYKANSDQAKQNLDLHFDLSAAKERLVHLDAQLADRNEALQEAKSEIKSLNMRTIEVPEVTPDVPLNYAEAKPIIERAAQTRLPKRSRRGKITGEP